MVFINNFEVKITKQFLKNGTHVVRIWQLPSIIVREPTATRATHVYFAGYGPDLNLYHVFCPAWVRADPPRDM